MKLFSSDQKGRVKSRDALHPDLIVRSLLYSSNMLGETAKDFYYQDFPRDYSE